MILKGFAASKNAFWRLQQGQSQNRPPDSKAMPSSADTYSPFLETASARYLGLVGLNALSWVADGRAV
jgi:hypothetical protein